MSKCYSKCRKVPEELCRHDECRYIDGTRFKYCRLSPKYKLDEHCIAQPKEQKKVQTQKRRLNPKVAAIALKKHRATQKINKFMRKVDPHKRRARFLSSICSDASVCMAFGKETDTIIKHFDGFVDFKHIHGPIKRIGPPSQNGFVNEITYERNGYVANSILKSSASESADNLFFEYLVGQYINKQCRIFPCFVETYGWFVYKNQDDWMHMRNTRIVENTVVKNSLQLPPTDFDSLKSMEIACTHSKYLAILIQHIKDAKSLDSLSKQTLFVKQDLVSILYQIYMPLATLANTFNHYDLHLDNVLVYEPVKGKYIQYRYVLTDGEVVEFKSSYIAKLIDYGRSFFVDEAESGITSSSKSIYDTICKIKKCNPNCGEDYGFGNVAPEYFPGSFYYISASKRNMSHDLRLLDGLHTNENIKKMNPNLYDLLEKVEYGVGLKEYKLYGTKEQDKPSKVDKSNMPEKIVNVVDAHQALKCVVLANGFQNDADYATMESLGTMNIYQSGRAMEFVSK